MTTEQRAQFQLDLATMNEQGYFFSLQDNDSEDMYDAYATEHEAELKALEHNNSPVYQQYGITTKVVRVELPLKEEYR